LSEITQECLHLLAPKRRSPNRGLRRRGALFAREKYRIGMRSRSGLVRRPQHQQEAASVAVAAVGAVGLIGSLPTE
jgi:hypothetical protein